MKINNSKKQLAKIIHENEGWRDGYDFSAQDGDDYAVWFYDDRPVPGSGRWWKACGRANRGIEGVGKLPNWHQTILSRDEYFHLYPAPDADGWIQHDGKHEPAIAESGLTLWCKWSDGLEQSHEASMIDWLDDSEIRIIAYRLNKPEAGIETLGLEPTIEQLAADYRNAKDYAERKQQEADEAKADVGAKLKALELAGEALGLLVSPITEKQGPELVITDWRDLQAGDVISFSGKWWEPDSEYTVDENDGSRDAPIRVGGYWALIGECSFKFIRRP